MSNEDFSGLVTSIALAKAESVKTWQYIVAAFHWSCLKHGLKVISSNQDISEAQSQSEELLPDKWSEKDLVQVQYQDKEGNQYEVRARPVDAKTDAVLLEMLRKKDLEMVSVALDVQNEVDGQTDPRHILKKPEELVRKFNTDIFEPILIKPEHPKSNAHSSNSNDPRPHNPLCVHRVFIDPHRGTVPPARNVGQEDLYPFGPPPHAGNGGMLFDPLNYFHGQGRRGQPRIDPVHPLQPMPRNPRPDFDHDHFRPPGRGGFGDDMFM